MLQYKYLNSYFKLSYANIEAWKPAAPTQEDPNPKGVEPAAEPKLVEGGVESNTNDWEEIWGSGKASHEGDAQSEGVDQSRLGVVATALEEELLETDELIDPIKASATSGETTSPDANLPDMIQVSPEIVSSLTPEVIVGDLSDELGIITPGDLYKYKAEVNLNSNSLFKGVDVDQLIKDPVGPNLEEAKLSANENQSENPKKKLITSLVDSFNKVRSTPGDSIELQNQLASLIREVQAGPTEERLAQIQEEANNIFPSVQANFLRSRIQSDQDQI